VAYHRPALGSMRRVLREFEYEIEHLSDVFGKIGDVFVERTVIDGKELDLVVLERNELGEVKPTLSRSFVVPLPRAQDQLHGDKCRYDLIGRITRNGCSWPAPPISAAAASAFTSLAVTLG